MRNPRLAWKERRETHIAKKGEAVDMALWGGGRGYTGSLGLYKAIWELWSGSLRMVTEQYSVLFLLEGPHQLQAVTSAASGTLKNNESIKMDHENPCLPVLVPPYPMEPRLHRPRVDCLRPGIPKPRSSSLSVLSGAHRKGGPASHMLGDPTLVLPSSSPSLSLRPSGTVENEGKMI